ncbi:MAG: tryptophan-rich sensory protein [Pyrinomonadaceae bacterium]|nr:tryptophan-rich sensory protein [Pyrinomonadaceae bacterium]
MLSKISRILVPLALAAVIYINYLAGTGQIGGITPEYISAKYPTLITPAGYAFSIWGLIYLLMIAFSAYQLFKSGFAHLDKVRWFFILSCVGNISWIFAWHNHYLGLSVVAMLVLLSSLVLINLSAKELDSAPDEWLVRVPFSIYFGWVSVATVLNVTIFLISQDITAGVFASKVIACLLIATLAIVGIVIREKLNAAFYPLTVAWAVTAIGVKQSGNTAIVVACAIAVIVLILSSLTFVLKTESDE